jgi:hypothetical protein
VVLELHLGDELVLKRTHPCGSDRWSVERLGADIGIRCTKCGRQVMVERPHLERRVRHVVRPPKDQST